MQAFRVGATQPRAQESKEVVEILRNTYNKILLEAEVLAIQDLLFDQQRDG